MLLVAPDGSELAPRSKPQPDGTLVKALARAWRWQRMLDAGVYTSVSEIGKAEAIDKGYVSRILRLALLMPEIVDAILEGQVNQALVLEKLTQRVPIGWREQRQRFLIPRPSHEEAAASRRAQARGDPTHVG